MKAAKTAEFSDDGDSDDDSDEDGGGKASAAPIKRFLTSLPTMDWDDGVLQTPIPHY